MGCPWTAHCWVSGLLKKQSRGCEKWAINVHVFWYGLGREWPWIAGSQGEPLICDFSGILTEGFTIPELVF